MSFVRFLASGGLSTLLDLLFFRVLVYGLLVPALVAYPLSYSLCVVIRYFIDARLTFVTDRMHWRQFLAYFVANVIVMGLGMVAFRIAGGYFSPMSAKLLSVPVTVLSGFVIMRLVVFRKPKEAA